MLKSNNLPTSGKKLVLRTRICQNILRMAAVPEEDGIQLSLPEKIFLKWIMNKSGVTEEMKRGSANEAAVRNQLKEQLGPGRTDADLEAPWRITAMAQVGLVHLKGFRFIACSPDGLVVLQRVGGTSPHFRAVVEIKTIQSEDGITALSAYASSHGTFHDIYASTNPESFKEAVPDVAHRAQLLHHCATCDVQCVLYVRATLLHIVTASLVHFEESFLEVYKKAVLEEVKNEIFPWMEPEGGKHLPRDARALRFDQEHLPDYETCYQVFELWKGLHVAMEKEPLGILPPARTISPYAVTMYNCTMGGEDITKQQEVRLHVKGQSRTPHQALVLSVIKRTALNYHAICRVANIESDLQKYRRIRREMKQGEVDGRSEEDIQELRDSLPFQSLRELRRRQGKAPGACSFDTRMNKSSVLSAAIAQGVEAMVARNAPPAAAPIASNSRNGMLGSPAASNAPSAFSQGDGGRFTDEQREEAMRLKDALATKQRATKNAFEVFNDKTKVHYVLRLTKGVHQHAASKSQSCLYCSINRVGENGKVEWIQRRKTTNKCSACCVPLCVTPYGLSRDGRATTSCWDLWHAQVRMERPFELKQHRARTDAPS